jgi:hypothetical protein
VIPIGSGCAALIASMKGKLKIKGRILSTGISWDADTRRPGGVRCHCPSDS